MWHKVRAIAAEEAAKARNTAAGTKSEGPHGWKHEVDRLGRELATLRSEVERLAVELAALKSGRAGSAASPDRAKRT